MALSLRRQFGARLRAIRQERKLTQEQFAELVPAHVAASPGNRGTALTSDRPDVDSTRRPVNCREPPGRASGLASRARYNRSEVTPGCTDRTG
jgi:hypothetical protein